MRLEGVRGAGTWAADEKGCRCTDWGGDAAGPGTTGQGDGRDVGRVSVNEGPPHGIQLYSLVFT